MRRIVVLGAALATFGVGALLSGEEKGATALDFTVKKIDGTEISLSKYKGKVMLIVNVASECGYTPQYAALQTLHKRYAKKGLAVLGFPANEFGGQEPGGDKEIQQFCKKKFGVDFDMFSKVVVKGEGRIGLFKYLTEHSEPKGDIKWNFEKFLIGRDGAVVGRFRSDVEPSSDEMIKAIETALAAK